MKKIIISFLCTIFIVGFLTSCQSFRLYNQAMKASSNNKYTEALGYLEELLEIDKKNNKPWRVARDLNDIGVYNSFLGRYEEALKYLKESLEIRRKYCTPYVVAYTLTNLGKIYHDSGSYDDALGCYREAFAIYGKIDYYWHQHSCLSLIGDVYCSMGEYDVALHYYKEVLETNRKVNHSFAITNSLNIIGKAYTQFGEYDEALKHYDEALDISRKNKYFLGTAECLDNIGEIYLDMAQGNKALAHFEESLAIKKKHKIPQPYIATSLNNIGMVYLLDGQFDKALQYHEEALKIRKEMNDLGAISATLNNLGMTYYYLDMFDDAMQCHQEALKIRKQFNMQRYMAESLNNIALNHHYLGQYEEALISLGEALKIVDKLNLQKEKANLLSNMGVFYSQTVQYSDALRYFESALKIRENLNDHLGLAVSYNTLGYLYLGQKEYQKAEEYFEKEEKEHIDITGLDLRKLGGFNAGKAEVFIATRRYNNALELLKANVPQWRDSITYRIQYHTQKGLALKGVGDFSKSSQEFLMAVFMIEETRKRAKNKKMGFLDAGYYGGRVRAYCGLFSSLSERVLKGEKKDTDFDNYGKDLASAAFYFAEATKARVLLEAMAESARKSRHVGIPEGLREKEQSLLNQISAIDSQWEDAYKKGEDVLKTFKEGRDGLTAELNALINELRQKYPEYAALYYPKPVPSEELPLKDNEILLEYALSDDACYLFVVRKGGVKGLYKIPLGKEALEIKVQEFVDAIKDPVYKKFPIMAAKELYDILLAQPLKDIKTGDKVIIVPDGILGALPFESLVVKEGNSINDSVYAGDVYTLSYYQSASVLSMLRHLKREKAKRALFALGNPVYSAKDERYIAYKERKSLPVKLAQQGDHAAFRAMSIESKWGKTTKDDKNADELAFKPLPETEDEVKAVAALFDVQPEPPDVLLGINANETNLRKSPLREYRYLHFATHADLPGKVQGIKEPFLLLGQVENKGKDDGFLTMSEVLDLELNAEMVVLSACLTGRGKVMAGEGVMNFARAFQHAGARSVLVSLWDVASNEAVEYMDIFYKHVKDGKSRTDAMKQARKEIKSRYPHPFYWSVFVLYGEG